MTKNVYLVYLISFSSLFLCTQSFAQKIGVIYIKGEVLVGDKGKKLKPAKKNMTLSTGQIIKTGESGLALLKNDSMTIKVMKNSTMILSLGKSSNTLTVPRGGAVLRYVKKGLAQGKVGLKVKTKTASLGVRGTTFMVYSREKSNSILSVRKGDVDFQGNGSDQVVSVGSSKTAMTNIEQKNLRPRNFGLNDKVNWDLKEGDDLSQPSAFYSHVEKMWQQYKKEQEVKWNNYKSDQDKKWKNFINN